MESTVRRKGSVPKKSVSSIASAALGVIHHHKPKPRFGFALIGKADNQMPHNIAFIIGGYGKKESEPAMAA